MLFRRRTFPRGLFLVPIVILSLIGGWLLFTRERPTPTNLFPAPGAVAIPGLAPIQITFSSAMNHEAVEQNLFLEPTHPGSFAWEGDTLTFTPSTPWPSGAVISATLGTGARSALGLPLAEAPTWSFSVARTMLAYLWPADGTANLYMLDPVGGTVIQLTEMGGVLEFSVGANGLAVYFSARNNSGGSGVWTLDLLTRESTPLFDCGQDLCALPQPSAGGTWLVYENTSQGELWLLPLAGGAPFRLGLGTRPQWSTDDKLAFYDRATQTFQIVDPTGVVLASFPNQMGEPGAWSADGAYFTTPNTDAQAESSRLYAFLTINGLINDLSGEGFVEDTSPAYSPDGQWLVFARKFLDAERWTPGRQVWVMEANGDNAHPLTNDEFFSHTSFAWSPDNQFIAFVKAHRTAPDARPELWMIGRDGSNPVQLVIGGYAPQWIP
ncbi:MAG: Ig-like domain-containing protein [Anaerolineales bacterium]|nr:Ig-like domain-containing protein [Anaerolineales bacterium]